MSRFVDVYLSSKIPGYPMDVGPRFSTQMNAVDSGAETANRRWADPLRDINIPSGVRDMEQFEAVKKHWLVMGGPARTWPLRDPTDFATVDLDVMGEEPTVTATDCVFGTGDGATTSFQLYKTYDIGSPAVPYNRLIQCPRLAGLLIAVDGVALADTSPLITATVSRPGGIVTFSTAPNPGAVLTWGGFFDLIVRFEGDDTFRGIVRAVAGGGFGDIPLKEIPHCED